jgi:Ca-activated chloride channel family protein
MVHARLWSILTLALTPYAVAQDPVPPGVVPPSIAPRHARWLAEHAVLLTHEERAAFERIERDYRRDSFIERFWQVRDPHPQTVHNELRDAWETRLALARERYGTLDDVRAQVLLLIGEPAERRRTDCPELLRPAEVWWIPPSAQFPEGASVVFVKRADRPSVFEGWSPEAGLADLAAADARPRDSPEKLAEAVRSDCPHGRHLLAALELAIPLGRLREQAIPHPDSGWIDSFDERSTTLAEDAREFPALLRVDYPGRERDRTVVEATLSVPSAALLEAGRVGAYRFVVDGEVLRRERLLESFRYRFEVPAPPSELDDVELVIQRLLRPGAYSLLVRLESLDTQRFHRATREIVVPVAGDEEDAGPGARLTAGEPSIAAAFAASVPTGDRPGGHTITLAPPPGGLHTGRLRVAASTTGDGIHAVAFELDGKRLMTKRRAPWSIELDLGSAPRLHDLRAVALGPDDEELASDRIPINAGPQSFTVRLIEPERGRRYEASVRARAVVDVPRGSRLDRLEFHVGERRLATLFQPPWTQVLPLAPDVDLDYVRAVAYLDDGLSTEALAFVNSPQRLDEVDVHMVELYTTVVDRRGRPVEGLGESDFEVRENDVAQRLRRFEHARDLPFHAAVVLDTSISMAEELRDSERAALAFFRNLVTPRDRAAVVTFSDQPRLAVPFTSDLEVLAGGLADLRAGGETALYDSLVFTLYHFGGLSGQRALILLSDGEDSMSRYSFEETLDFARQTGVAIFAIGLDLPGQAHEARAKLVRLCEETGGQHFFIGRANEIGRVYQRIEQDLRSQYLIAYQSSLEGEGFRAIEVRLSDPALEARTISGYDP